MQIYADVVRETLDYVLSVHDRRTRAASTARKTPTARAKKAKFYVWTPDEIGEVLATGTWASGSATSTT